MIGMRAGVSAGVAVLGLAMLFTPRTADPTVAVTAERLIHDRAATAVAALDDLRDAIDPGLDAARIGAAGVVSGDEPPSAQLEAAAARITQAESAVLPARRAVMALSAARGAWRPGTKRIPEPVAVGELSSIGGQLRAAGDAADAFVDLRLRGTGLPGVLDEVFTALDHGDLEAAEERTARARADHDALVAWDTDLVTLPVWIETTDAMIRAVEQILGATRNGDDDAAIEGAGAFTALADEAATADRALRIALSEGGSALTAAPLERIAVVLGDVEASRAAAAAILAGASR